MSNIYPTRPQRLDFAGESSFEFSLNPCRKGSTFVRILQILELDLTDHRIRMSVKEGYEENRILFFDSDETDTNEPRIELEVVDPEEKINNVVLRIPASVTETLDAGDSDCWPRRKRYVYDMEIVTPEGEVYAILEGEFHVVDEVTIEA